MRHSVSKDLYAYWNWLRGARAAPDRSDIDPAAISACAGGQLHCRNRAGPRLSDPAVRHADERALAVRSEGQILPRSVARGRSPQCRGRVATVVDGATPVVAGALACPPSVDDGRSGANVAEFDRDLNLELLLLPLRHFGKTHSRLLGSLSSSNQTSWFGRAVAAPLYLKSLRIIRAQEQKPTAQSSSVGRSPRGMARPAPAPHCTRGR